jgi:hypothetical protein
MRFFYLGGSAGVTGRVLVQVKGWQRSFQPSMKASMAAMRSLTEVKLPRRIAYRVMMPKKISINRPSGADQALSRISSAR